MPKALKPFSRRQKTNGTLNRRQGVRVIVPKTLQAAVLKQVHYNHPGIAHPGIARMNGLARGHVWWPSFVKTLAKSCQSCLAVKQAPPTAPVHPWTWPSKPWQRVVDFVGPFLNKMYLIFAKGSSITPALISQSKLSVCTLNFMALSYQLKSLDTLTANLSSHVGRWTNDLAFLTRPDQAHMSSPSVPHSNRPTQAITFHANSFEYLSDMNSDTTPNPRQNNTNTTNLGPKPKTGRPIILTGPSPQKGL